MLQSRPQTTLVIIMMGNFRGVPIFVIIVVDLADMKVSTHGMNASTQVYNNNYVY